MPVILHLVPQSHHVEVLKLFMLDILLQIEVIQIAEELVVQTTDPPSKSV
jgi:hypothetical protein